MKIVFLAHEPSLSGANLVLIEHVKFLKEKGIECKVIFPGLGPAAILLLNEKINVEIVPYRWWVFQNHLWGKLYPFRRLLRIILEAWDFSKVLKRYRPDVVISNTLTSPVGAFAAKFRKISHFWYIHEFGKEDQGFKFLFGEKATFWLIDFFSEKVVLVSYALKEKFLFAKDEKIAVIYNGLLRMNLDNPKKHLGLDKESVDVLSVGRFEPGKNFEDLINAAAELKKAKLGKRPKFIILGPFIKMEYLIFLQNLAKELNVLELFSFVDYVPDPSEYFKNADLFVITSKKEAFGLVTIEAMNNGLPVIGSDGGANPELIHPGKNGFLYKIKDGKDLAEKITHLINDKPLRTKLGENSFKFSLSFNSERSCKEMYELLENFQNNSNGK